jgi:hypothetical protein
MIDKKPTIRKKYARSDTRKTGENTKALILHGVFLAIAPLPADVRGELVEAVSRGVIGRLARDGNRPESFFPVEMSGRVSEKIDCVLPMLAKTSLLIETKEERDRRLSIRCDAKTALSALGPERAADRLSAIYDLPLRGKVASLLLWDIFGDGVGGAACSAFAQSMAHYWAAEKRWNGGVYDFKKAEEDAINESRNCYRLAVALWMAGYPTEWANERAGLAQYLTQEEAESGTRRNRAGGKRAESKMVRLSRKAKTI